LHGKRGLLPPRNGRFRHSAISQTKVTVVDGSSFRIGLILASWHKTSLVCRDDGFRCGCCQNIFVSGFSRASREIDARGWGY